MYRRTNSRGRPILILLIIVSVGIASLYYGGTQTVIGSLQRTALAVVSPVQKGVNAIVSPFGSISNYSVRLSNTKSLNRQLTEENELLKKEVRDLKKYRKENIDLRLLAGFRQDTDQKTVAARIISRSPSNWQSLVTIGIGSKRGIEAGQAVVTQNGLVGKIVEVSGSAAVVQLADDRRSGTAVEISRTGATGIVSGLMNNKLSLRFVQGSEDIAVGDRLLTSGAGGVNPRGIQVGKIAQIDKTPYSLELQIKVEPSVDYARLISVLVVVDK